MTRFLLDYDDEVVRVKWEGFTNHRLRNMLIGLWLALDEADRKDHIAELLHYLEPGSRPPGESRLIGDQISAARGAADLP
jgi:hypothetical protein